MRVFIGLLEIAGYYSNLKKGFRELGVDCTFIDISKNPFQYGGVDRPNRLVGWFIDSGARFIQTPSRKIGRRAFWFLVHGSLRLPTFVWALWRFDAFIFGFRTSFLFFLDFPVLRLFRKKVICTFNGSDARPPYIDGFLTSDFSEQSLRKCIVEAGRTKRALRKIERYADVLVNHPASAHLLERPFIISTILGIPYVPPSATAREKEPTDAVRILHAPSNPAAKGSPVIRQAITTLKQAGHNIDFVEVTGQPHAIVCRELARCDFVVDQAYSDAPFPGLATEAAFFGKPTVIGGYYATLCESQIPKSVLPPSVFCHPDELQTSIERLILDEDLRVRLGREAGEFVRARWTPSEVAKRFLAVLEATFPEEWLCSPDTIEYLHGLGLPEHKVRELVARVVELGGVSALQLDDKPELQRLFVEFAEGAGNRSSTPDSLRAAGRC